MFSSGVTGGDSPVGGYRYLYRTDGCTFSAGVWPGLVVEQSAPSLLVSGLDWWWSRVHLLCWCLAWTGGGAEGPSILSFH